MHCIAGRIVTRLTPRVFIHSVIAMRSYIQESIELKGRILEDYALLAQAERAVTMLLITLQQGRKVLVAGNGGSAADAQHFAAELVGRFKKERRGYPVIALTTDTSVLTAWSNDYDFESVFSRQIEALGSRDDVFIGISTSGMSKNIIRAVEQARRSGLRVILFLGKDGGMLKGRGDIEIIVPSTNTPRIQEAHILLIHGICEEIEKQLA